ncbi:hypothetical protein FDECE_5563 [Fusarium decemcellulare]|nr:hypothetical protein FDECE_5563 [Fusarium decemcellulare]
MLSTLGLAALGLQASLVAASSKLFSGATIISFNDESSSLEVIRNGSLLVTNDKIAAISGSKPSYLPPDTEEIDVSGQIITPGFIDTHRHGWMTAFKTIMSNTTLVEYFMRYRDPPPALGFTSKDVYLSQLAGLYETLNAGVTTILDHAHHNWSPSSAWAGFNASVDSGARVFWAYSFQDAPVTNYTVSEQIPAFEKLAAYNTHKSSLTELGIAYDHWGPNPDAAEAQEIADLAVQYNVSVVTTHSVGGHYGSDNMPKHVDAFGLLNTSIPVVFSHGTYITEEDANLLRASNQYFSITPESEALSGFGHPYSYDHLDQAALGVDTHSALSADLLSQARRWLQDVRLHFFDQVNGKSQIPSKSPMSTYQAFVLATRAGGLALRRPDLGVIQVGAKADLVVWDAENSPALMGWNDPIVAVILHASVGDILHVLVDGKFVKRNGRLTAPDYPQIRKEFTASARKIQGVLKNTPYPVLEGQLAPGVEFAVPRYADTQRGPGNGYGEQFFR